MTQTYHPDDDRPDKLCGVVSPQYSRCTLPIEHVGDHFDEMQNTSWAQHHVIRLDNGDAEKLPRLAQLVAMYDAAKNQADAAAEQLKAVTDGIKLEVAQAMPGKDFTIVSRHLASSLTLQYVQSERVDTRLLRSMLGERYRSVCKMVGSWTLKRKR